MIAKPLLVISAHNDHQNIIRTDRVTYINARRYSRDAELDRCARSNPGSSVDHQHRVPARTLLEEEAHDSVKRRVGPSSSHRVLWFVYYLTPVPRPPRFGRHLAGQCVRRGSGAPRFPWYQLGFKLTLVDTTRGIAPLTPLF